MATRMHARTPRLVRRGCNEDFTLLMDGDERGHLLASIEGKNQNKSATDSRGSSSCSGNQPQPHAERIPLRKRATFPASFLKGSGSEMGCSSGRQPPAPVLHPDLDCSHGGDANALPQDSENQNVNSSGSVEGPEVKPPESLPTLERLAQATGGTEKSWYRCVFPFGVISLVIGMAGTGVTFTFDNLLQTKVVSVALLCIGVVMLLVAAVCWRAHRLRRRKKKEGGFFTTDLGTL